MEYISHFVDLFLHLDKHLGELVKEYGTWTYLVLFIIVFCETGLVVTPILPGDSANSDIWKRLVTDDKVVVERFRRAIGVHEMARREALAIVS